MVTGKNQTKFSSILRLWKTYSGLRKLTRNDEKWRKMMGIMETKFLILNGITAHVSATAHVEAHDVPIGTPWVIGTALGSTAHDRRVLNKPAMNVYVKRFDVGHKNTH